MTLALASKIFFLWLAIAHIKAFTLSLILVSTITLLVWANGAFSDL